MLVPLHWRQLYFGTLALTFASRAGIELELRWIEGGGFVPSIAVWRLARRVAHVLEAAEC